ncbi:hypothetical protein [Nonomuraea candida]|uniref:hypothetical protein n=1 Tax=Nonomuraea candida TaxID=359159 RepID=UPI0005BC731A|nr:hypothetical protein [Nonomuraea candida]
MSITTSPAAGPSAVTPGTLLDIPSSAMPPELLDPPAPAVVIETGGGRDGTACIAAVALEWTPFLTFRWSAKTPGVADVAAWPDLVEARMAARALTLLLDQEARGEALRPLVYCREAGADRPRWRLIGPSWGGTVEQVREGRVRVFTDHVPDPVGYSASLRAGARRLARLHCMPAAVLV